MKMNRLTLKGVAVMAGIVCASTTVLSGSASATVKQFPSGDGGGITVDWSGDWVSTTRLQEVTLQLCDSTPADKNRATAVLQGYVTRGGAARIDDGWCRRQRSDQETQHFPIALGDEQRSIFFG